MLLILDLTGDQSIVGVQAASLELRDYIKSCFTFTKLPTESYCRLTASVVTNRVTSEFLELLESGELNSIEDEAIMLLSKHSSYKALAMRHFNVRVLIDCPVYFASYLESALREAGIQPLYSFKDAEGNHLGFIEK